MKQGAKVTKQHKGEKTARRVGAPQGPRKADLRRTALIEAAEKLFVKKGYEATTMNEIAATAGFAKGTLYHYFKNKAELLLVLRDAFEDEVLSRIQSRVEGCRDYDWHGKIRAWVYAAVAAYFELSELHDVVIYSLETPFRKSVTNSRVNQYLAKLVGDGARAGAWQVDDEHWTAVVMFYGFRGGCDEAILGTQRAEDVPEKLNDLFLRMLGVHG
jgi:AcrR family transcriptional regulator